jgi:elongation factor Ts
MAITAADVNKLRTMTGVGMMDCKNALVEADGDFDKAVDILRKKGQKVAAKRADREANEGFVYAISNNEHTFAAIVMINCESDFVGKNIDFVNFVKSVADLAIENKVSSKDSLLQTKLNDITIEEHLTQMTGKIGEKIELSRYEVVEAEFVANYNHNGNRLASIVGFNKRVENIETIAHDIAMQIAAMNPVSITPEGVDQTIIDKELEIARDLARQEGKPEEMLDKIAQGRLNKFYKESTLLNQEFIKDGKKPVGQYLTEIDKDLTCTSFKRLQLGA